MTPLKYLFWKKRVLATFGEHNRTGKYLKKFSAVFALLLASPLFAGESLIIPPLRMSLRLVEIKTSKTVTFNSRVVVDNSSPLKPVSTIEVLNFDNLLMIDLLQIYQLAKQEDAVYASAQAEYNAGKEKASQARAGFLPQFTASATIAKAVSAQQNLPHSRYDTNGYSVSFIQPLIRPQTWATYRQAKQQVLQSEFKLSASHQDLIQRVAKAYFGVLLAQDNVRVSQSQKLAFERQLEQAKRTFEVGTSTITDTNESQAKYDQSVAKEIADQNELQIKKDALRQIILKTPQRLSPLIDDATFDQFISDKVGEWENIAEAENQTISISRAEAEIAKFEISKQRSGHLPTLDLVLSYIDNRNGVPNIFGGQSNFRSTQIGLQLTIPLYAGGSVTSRVARALADQQRALSDLEQKRRASLQTVRSAFLGVNSGAIKIKSLEQALKSSKVSLESTKLGREVGVRTTVDVLNSEQQVFQAQRDLSQAKYELLINQLNLLAAAGRLKEEDLIKINDMLAK